MALKCCKSSHVYLFARYQANACLLHKQGGVTWKICTGNSTAIGYNTKDIKWEKVLYNLIKICFTVFTNGINLTSLMFTTHMHLW